MPAQMPSIVLALFFDEAEPATEEPLPLSQTRRGVLKENKQDDIIPLYPRPGYDASPVLEAIRPSTEGTAIRDALRCQCSRSYRFHLL